MINDPTFAFAISVIIALIVLPIIVIRILFIYFKSQKRFPKIDWKRPEREKRPRADGRITEIKRPERKW